MSFNNNKKSNNDDFSSRVNKLLSKDTDFPKQTDEELAQHFNKIFSTQPIAAQRNPSYHIPENAYSDNIDREIEKMLQDSDDEDDAIDQYIYNVLDSSSSDMKGSIIQERKDRFQKIFIRSDDTRGTDERDALIKRLQEENALDAKYEQFTKDRDEDLEKRYNALKKDRPNFSNYEPSFGNQGDSKPRGSIPKPLQNEDLHDEMDDWCCICNEDATIGCEGCEDDNKYCKECFFHTHQSEFADYEATKHKSKRYQK